MRMSFPLIFFPLSFCLTFFFCHLSFFLLQDPSWGRLITLPKEMQPGWEPRQSLGTSEHNHSPSLCCTAVCLWVSIQESLKNTVFFVVLLSGGGAGGAVPPPNSVLPSAMISLLFMLCNIVSAQDPFFRHCGSVWLSVHLSDTGTILCGTILD